MAEPAMMAPHSVFTGFCMLRNASGKVYISNERMTTKGEIKLFQELMNEINAKVPRAGPSSGKTMDQ